MKDAHSKVIIIGSGPAAHTAAIYAGRAFLKPTVFEGFMAGGIAAGGQLTTTTDVENFPGFPHGISGNELMERMRQQSIECGAVIVTETVTSIDSRSTPFKVKTSDDHEYTADTIIIATGATAKRLDLPGEQEFWQKGVSACAVCDGPAPIFKNKHIIVVGGGDSAAEEAIYLTKYASKVTILVRKDRMRASQVMQQRVLNHPKIQVLYGTRPVELEGSEVLERVVTENVLTGERRYLEAGGLFYAIGHIPNVSFLNGQVELDKSGYVLTMNNSTQTSVRGIFACGDVQDSKYRQAITAAGSGCMAALDAERFLDASHSKI